MSIKPIVFAACIMIAGMVAMHLGNARSCDGAADYAACMDRAAAINSGMID